MSEVMLLKARNTHAQQLLQEQADTIRAMADTIRAKGRETAELRAENQSLRTQLEDRKKEIARMPDVIEELKAGLSAKTANAEETLVERWQEIRALKAEKEELRERLVECDSLISLIRHRRALDWGTRSLPEQWEVDQLIGRIRVATKQEEKPKG